MYPLPVGFPKTDRKRCPQCYSDNVKDTGNRKGIRPSKANHFMILEPKIPIYNCHSCDLRFLYLDQ